MTSSQRGAACTAWIHSSRLASHWVEPCSHPMAVPASTVTLSFSLPLRIWNPNSVDFTRDLMSTGKPCSSSSILQAAAKTPPGGAVGTLMLLTTTSKGLALGSFFFFW